MFLERQEGKERNIDVKEKYRLLAYHKHLDWELNLRPFSHGMAVQPIEPDQPKVNQKKCLTTRNPKFCGINLFSESLSSVAYFISAKVLQTVTI